MSVTDRLLCMLRSLLFRTCRHARAHRELQSVAASVSFVEAVTIVVTTCVYGHTRTRTLFRETRSPRTVLGSKVRGPLFHVSPVDTLERIANINRRCISVVCGSSDDGRDDVCAWAHSYVYPVYKSGRRGPQEQF